MSHESVQHTLHCPKDSTDLTTIQRTLLDALSTLGLAQTQMESSGLSDEYRIISYTIEAAHRTVFQCIQQCERTLSDSESPTQFF